MKTCPQCSITFPDSAYFCSKDGSRLFEANHDEARATDVLECQVCGAKSPATEQMCTFCGARLTVPAFTDVEPSRHPARKRFPTALAYLACLLLALSFGGWFALHRSSNGSGLSPSAPAVVALGPVTASSTQFAGVSQADAAAFAHLDPAATARLASTIDADLARLEPPPQLFGKPGAALASIEPNPAVAALPPVAAPEPDSNKPVPPLIEPETAPKPRTQSAAIERRSRLVQRKRREFASIHPAFPRPMPREAPLAARTEAQNQLRGLVGAVLGPSAGGVLIYDVYDEGPAARAGIRRGDVIVEYAGMPVHNPHKLVALITKTDIGAEVKVNLLRQGKQIVTVLTVVDWSEGRGSLRQSATRGDAFAQVELGTAYYRGWGGERNYDEAISWFRRAAEQGNAEAQSSLGLAYASGAGVAQDNAQAVTWYRKAAAQGLAGAQYRLGLMYEKGISVEQDYHEALSFFQKAAAQDSAEAQVSLGVMYYNGEGVERDYAEAVSWFRKAAQQGDANAQYDLGAMYASGRGVARDDDQALTWYRKAAAQGQEKARKAIERIARNGGR